jgi:hypothetical protein
MSCLEVRWDVSLTPAAVWLDPVSPMACTTAAVHSIQHMKEKASDLSIFRGNIRKIFCIGAHS